MWNIFNQRKVAKLYKKQKKNKNNNKLGKCTHAERWARICRERKKRERNDFYFIFCNCLLPRKNGTGRSKSKISSMTYVDSNIWTDFFISTFFFLSNPVCIAFIYTHTQKKTFFWIAFHKFFFSSQVQNISMNNINSKHNLTWICTGYFVEFVSFLHLFQPHNTS